MRVEQPHRHRGVEAAGDGILDGHAVLREERPHLEVDVRARAGAAPPAPRSPTSVVGLAASTASTLSRRRAIHPGPLSTHSAATTRGRVDAGGGRQRGDELVVGRAAAHDRRGGERQAAVGAAHPHETGRALLHHDVGARRLAAGLQPGVARAERRMAGEGQLAARREDPHPVVGAGLRRREDERRLGEVRPVGDAGELVVGEPVTVEHDGDRVAAVRRLGEHVDLGEAALHGRRAWHAHPSVGGGEIRPPTLG